MLKKIIIKINIKKIKLKLSDRLFVCKNKYKNQNIPILKHKPFIPSDKFDALIKSNKHKTVKMIDQMKPNL